MIHSGIVNQWVSPDYSTKFLEVGLGQQKGLKMQIMQASADTLVSVPLMD